MWRFADALALNWLIVGTDAHAKNYGLLLAGTQIRLAPLYDIASYLPYDDSDGYKTKLAMKIGDDYVLRRTDRRSAWKHAAGELGLDSGRLVERLLDLVRRTADAFARARTTTWSVSGRSCPSAWSSSSALDVGDARRLSADSDGSKG